MRRVSADNHPKAEDGVHCPFARPSASYHRQFERTGYVHLSDMLRGDTAANEFPHGTVNKFSNDVSMPLSTHDSNANVRDIRGTIRYVCGKGLSG
jgi:hypothetical protein